MKDGYPHTQEELIEDRYAVEAEKARLWRRAQDARVKKLRKAAKKAAETKARNRALRLFVPH